MSRFGRCLSRQWSTLSARGWQNMTNPILASAKKMCTVPTVARCLVTSCSSTCSAGLSLDEEAEFLAALGCPPRPAVGKHTLKSATADADQAGRLRAKRWCGEHEVVSLTADMTENQRACKCPPTAVAGARLSIRNRDVHQDLRNGFGSARAQ